MLRIRLQRLGRNKQPTYRIIVSEKVHDTQYGSLEILGNYIPTLNPKVFTVNADRVKYWLSVGAQPSDTLHNLFITHGIMTGKKTKPITISEKRVKRMEKKAK